MFLNSIATEFNPLFSIRCKLVSPCCRNITLGPGGIRCYEYQTSNHEVGQPRPSAAGCYLGEPWVAGSRTRAYSGVCDRLLTGITLGSRCCTMDPLTDEQRRAVVSAFLDRIDAGKGLRPAASPFPYDPVPGIVTARWPLFVAEELVKDELRELTNQLNH